MGNNLKASQDMKDIIVPSTKFESIEVEIFFFFLTSIQVSNIAKNVAPLNLDLIIRIKHKLNKGKKQKRAV